MSLVSPKALVEEVTNVLAAAPWTDLQPTPCARSFSNSAAALRCSNPCRINVANSRFQTAKSAASWEFKFSICNLKSASCILTSESMTARTRTDILLLAGFCAFLFFYGLGSFGLIGADEPGYAQVAREMLDHHDWITPTLGGVAWLEKPPLYYWQAMASFAV